MAEDIVKRMERWATFSTYKEFVRDCREAAAEIVHLRAKLKTAAPRLRYECSVCGAKGLNINVIECKPTPAGSADKSEGDRP
jgi:hypothetical protein